MSVSDIIKANAVVVFSSSWCPYCRKAIAGLESAGISHRVIEVDGTLKSQLAALTGKTSVPQVFVKGTFIGGCNDDGLGGTLPLLRSGKLQAMLK